MIAISFALPEESKNFRRAWRQTAVVGSGVEQRWIGVLGEREIVLAHTGVGPDAAGRATRRLLAAHRPEWLLCAGYGGGLDPRLRVGDVVIDWRGRADFALAEARSALAARTFFGAIASHSHALETPAAKAAFARETRALAVDMETVAVAAVAAEYGIPVIGIRAISDTAQDELPVPMAHWFDLARQRPRPAALVWFLTLHPSRIASFARFVRGLPKARHALTKAVAHVILEAQ